ncbi:uncharacterized protein LOC131002940 [Salvia miltiorrhiza]|uniref:uncharacterized protein LOC131002940 n=1 Tax=Salvia miltiorrhiza TaxID=226208 RepID=UPI0025AD8327|nr:uncharacterized protein LOC131002940 [Salvia miltiorrhiza]
MTTRAKSSQLLSEGYKSCKAVGARTTTSDNDAKDVPSTCHEGKDNLTLPSPSLINSMSVIVEGTDLFSQVLHVLTMGIDDPCKNLAKDFDTVAGESVTGKTGIPSTQGINLSELTPPGFTTFNNPASGPTGTTPATTQSLIGTSAPGGTVPTSTQRLLNVTVTEQMLAMLNYATIRQLAGMQPSPIIPTGLGEAEPVTHRKTTTAPAQDKDRELPNISHPVTRKEMGNTGEGQGKNKRKFVTNSVQIEDVGDSTSGTTPQRSRGTQRENTRLKERVSFLKSQLKSLETELREHPQETVRNEVSDEEAYSSEEQEEELRREIPHKRRAMGTSGGRRRNAPHRQFQENGKDRYIFDGCQTRTTGITKGVRGQVQHGRVDYRDLNAACPKDCYPLPRIDQLVDATSGCELLSMMDAYQGYHQVKMHPDDVTKTAFAVCTGVFGWESMPFGLKNAGATYQRMMDKIFRTQLRRNISVYVDDMLVRSIKASSHVADLEETFSVVRKNKLMLNPAKCTFGVQSGKFLGYRVTPEGIEVNNDKVKAILNMTSPRNVKEIQTLNGRITALSRFISRSAERSLPFFKVLRKGSRFEWSGECQKAFEDLKAYLTKLPVLTKPSPGEPLYLYISVGVESLSSVLVREEDRQQKPIYFVSKVIQGAELCYTEVEKTAYTIMITARKLRPYFLSHKVIVRTIIPFRQILGRPDLAGKMVKWAIELGEYEVEFEPRTAIRAQALADFIQEATRWPMRGPWVAQVDGSVTKEGCGVGIYITSPEGEIYQFAIKFEDKLSNNEAEYEAVLRTAHIFRELRADNVVIKTDSQLVAQQLNGGYEIKEERMKQYFNKVQEIGMKFEKLEIQQVPREENQRADLLARMASAVEQTWRGDITLVFEPKREMAAQVCNIETKDDWRTPIIYYLKNGKRMKEDTSRYAKYENYCIIGDQLYKRSFTHPFLKCLAPEEAQFALKEIHQGCCGNHGGHRDLTKKIIRAGFYWPGISKESKAFVQKCEACQKHAPKINIPGEEMGIMHAAHPFDKWGIDIVVAVDYFSKWIEAEAVTKIDDNTVEKFIWKNICCRYGVPRILVSDNGTQFTSKKIEDFCSRMDITQKFVSVAHPQANGQVELANRTICEGIKKRLERSRGRWVEELDTVLWALRTSPKTATGEAPFTLVYGSNAVVPAEVRLESHRITTYDTAQNEELRRLDLDLIELQREEAQVRAAKYKSIIKAGYDKKVKPRRLGKEDLVLKRADALKPVGKFEANWEGPFVITEVLGGGAYHLADQGGRPLTRPWNISNLKKFYV